jgi:transposase
MIVGDLPNGGVPYATDLTDDEWLLLEPFLGCGGSRGPAPRVDRRTMMNAMLYQAKTGCQWRMIPSEFGNWNTIWRTWARWRDRGVWQQVMDLLRRTLRVAAGREAEPSLRMVDTQIAKGAQRGRSFHQGHGKYKLNGAKRTIVIDYLGLPVAVRVTGSRMHDVRAAKELLAGVRPVAEPVTTVMGDAGSRDMASGLEADYGVETMITSDPDRPKGEFRPWEPLWKVEAAFSELGRWRRLGRSFEATTASVTAWMQVAAVGWMLRLL